MMFLLVHSKSKHRPIASRTRGSWKASRRVLNARIQAASATIMQHFLDNAAVSSPPENHSRSPRCATCTPDDDFDRARLEHLERHLALAVIFKTRQPKVVLTDIDGQVLGPIIIGAIRIR